MSIRNVLTPFTRNARCNARLIHTVASHYLERYRSTPIPKGNCGIIAMIGEQSFESSEAFD